MSKVLDDPLAAGREAAQRHAWRDAYDLLKAVDTDGALAPDDLERLAEAAWWMGRLDEAIAARERAYAGFIQAGEKRRAATVALWLCQDHVNKGAYSVGHGWLAKAERLLEDEPESVEHGHLALIRAVSAMHMGNLATATPDIERAYELGKRYGDADLEALATVFKGMMLVRSGDLDQGLTLLDEATAAAVSGELQPFATGMVYCCTISSCQGVGDYGRAAEWTEAANRWCETSNVTGFPGLCRVHRAEILRLQGAWDLAEQQAVTACEELQRFNQFITGAGFYEIGEIRRRRGDFAAAEEAYAKANEWGRTPQPGLALLRLAQGKVDAAAAGIKRALEDAHDPLARARRLPAQVEIAIAAGDLRTARSAAEELDRVADTYRIGNKRTPAFDATAHLASGQIMLAEGDWESASRCLRRAWQEWQKVGAPYETAQARLLLGIAYRREGDEDGAIAELDAALATFERLDAKLDAERAKELLGKTEARRTFMFTDIVDSTRMAEALGEQKWKKLLGWHDKTLRDVIEANGGEVVKNTGDGFFAAFERPEAAMETAVAIQRALDAYDGVAPDVRIGLHVGTAFERDGDDLGGEAVHAAARIAALGSAGEIVASHESVEDGGKFRVSEPRSVELKGVSKPVEVVSIDWR